MTIYICTNCGQEQDKLSPKPCSCGNHFFIEKDKEVKKKENKTKKED